MDQNVPPSEETHNGRKWQSLGNHECSGGMLVVQLGGVPKGADGTTLYVVADAVRIFGITMDTGSGSKPAAHLAANVRAALSPKDPDKAFAFAPNGVEWTVFGVQEQPFITEAFATHTTRTKSPDGTVIQNSWRWGAAIELMNPFDEEIDLSGYQLDDTALTGKIPGKGGKVVLYEYDHGEGRSDANAAKVFGKNSLDKNTWFRVSGLNFDKGVVRLTRTAEGHKIPIDHVTAGGGKELRYGHVTNMIRTSIAYNKSVSEDSRRDNHLERHRYSVAKYWKSTSDTTSAPTVGNPIHRLGLDNEIGLAGAKSIPQAKLKEGFKVKLAHGLLDGPGALTDLYLAGPIINTADDKPLADLPHLLAEEYANEESRGRANSHISNPDSLNQDPWNIYPRRTGSGQNLAWPLIMGEIVETVPTDKKRGDTPSRVYGRININTAGREVLMQLPWPNGVNASLAASKLIAYRKTNKGFRTPGEAAMALGGFDATNKDIDRDSIYAAISSCITVNSDLYAVNIRVQVGTSKTPEDVWYYVAIVDRSCSMSAIDKPAVLLFMRVK